ncbi:MAG: hypothetical protein AAF460_12440 [Pseudomonadota bacterium]
MPCATLDFAEPFFGVTLLEVVDRFDIAGRAIVINLADRALQVEAQTLATLQSAIVVDAALEQIERAVVIDRFDAHGDDAALFAAVRARWPLAFDVRGEERLRGVEHYMSPKARTGNLGLSMYHSASVPLNVGLHRDHPFCAVPGFREVHTQIVGVGKMQQCRERDTGTLYLEEMLAPGQTHRPMYDAEGKYPWHQYETVTPSIFMAIELLPPGATFPA